MNDRPRGVAARALGAVVLCVVLGVLLAWAGGDGGIVRGGMAVFAWCAAAAFVVNWIAFVPASLLRTERFYDLTGSITYLVVVVIALAAGSGSATAMLLGALVSCWALRLGTFLVMRIRRAGTDGRFDTIKVDPVPFLMAWTLQALWVLVTVGCALAAMTATRSAGPWWPRVLGATVWLVGFGIEVVADDQKRRFREDPANRDRFIRSGLWAWSRHPNYFGEITLWTGIAVVAVPALSGWQYLTLVSPLFVAVLLTRVSGVPMLEARGRKQWGSDPEYLAYVERTPVLVPRPARRADADAP